MIYDTIDDKVDLNVFIILPFSKHPEFDGIIAGNA